MDRHGESEAHRSSVGRAANELKRYSFESRLGQVRRKLITRASLFKNEMGCIALINELQPPFPNIEGRICAPEEWVALRIAKDMVKVLQKLVPRIRSLVASIKGVLERKPGKRSDRDFVPRHYRLPKLSIEHLEGFRCS